MPANERIRPIPCYFPPGINRAGLLLFDFLADVRYVVGERGEHRILMRTHNGIMRYREQRALTITQSVLGIITGILFMTSVLAAQEHRPQLAVPDDAAKKIITEAELGIQRSEVDRIVSGFSRQVYIDVPGREGGYYSSNQARFVLLEYFRQCRVSQFKFGTIAVSEGQPFATGGGSVVTKGVRASFQVYLGLIRTGDRWVISQFSIY